MKIFVSHTTEDRELVDALDELFVGFFGTGKAELVRSSNQAQGAGVEPGESWRTWITTEIREADRVYVVLTPNSLQKPYVLWESGVAAGLALAGGQAGEVVPLTFGIDIEDIPDPFLANQAIKADTDEAGGVLRLLQSVNVALDTPLNATLFATATGQFVPPYLAEVAAAVAQARGPEGLLDSVPSTVTTDQIAGDWVTSYDFQSDGETHYHADIARITANTARRLSAKTLVARTQDRARPFGNVIDAELATRHLIGHWKNTGDTRYFGTIHLAVMAQADVMEGRYTSFDQDDAVAEGAWKWVRLSVPAGTGDLSREALRDPAEIHQILQGRSRHAGPIPLAEVTEARP